jgi:hypothetical protein
MARGSNNDHMSAVGFRVPLAASGENSDARTC